MNSSSPHFYVFDKFRLDPIEKVLWFGDSIADVAPKAVEVLLVLVEEAGRIVSKEEILEVVWPDSFVEEANLSNYIFKLRKVLGEDEGQKFIETVSKRGYRFVGEIKKEQEPLAQISDIRKNWKLLAGAIISLVTIAVTSWLLLSAKRNVEYPKENIKNIRSVAVMPFTNESGSDDAQYLSDGVTETLITSLSQLSDLGVKPSSVMKRYKGKDVSAATIGEELNVGAVLYGRMVQHGPDLTLFLSLIDTKTEYQVWGKQYVRKLDGLAQLQDEIGRDVAQSLSTRLTPPDENRLARNYSKNGEAYRLYLLGRFYWNKFTPADHQKASEYFNRAIASDSSYVLAYF